MRVEVAVRALFYTPGEVDVKRQCSRGGGKFHAGYFMDKSDSCPIKFLVVLFLNGFLCDNSFLNWNNIVMKRLAFEYSCVELLRKDPAQMPQDDLLRPEVLR